jgi:hypothetical protein
VVVSRTGQELPVGRKGYAADGGAVAKKHLIVAGWLPGVNHDVSQLRV